MPNRTRGLFLRVRGWVVGRRPKKAKEFAGLRCIPGSFRRTLGRGGAAHVAARLGAAATRPLPPGTLHTPRKRAAQPPRVREPPDSNASSWRYWSNNYSSWAPSCRLPVRVSYLGESSVRSSSCETERPPYPHRCRCVWSVGVCRMRWSQVGYRADAHSDRPCEDEFAHSYSPLSIRQSKQPARFARKCQNCATSPR